MYIRYIKATIDYKSKKQRKYPIAFSAEFE